MSKDQIKRKRRKIIAKSDRPRLSVFRSNQYMYAQIIDDEKHLTVISASDKEVEGKLTRMQKAQELGKIIAQKAKDKKISKVVFDKGVYKYHGRVKALADGAREGGLVF